jgi:hypothetical protein
MPAVELPLFHHSMISFEVLSSYTVVPTFSLTLVIVSKDHFLMAPELASLFQALSRAQCLHQCMVALKISISELCLIRTLIGKQSPSI